MKTIAWFILNLCCRFVSIANEILMSIRSSKKHRNEVSINDPIGIDGEGNEISLMDILGTTYDFCDQVESKMQIEKLRKIIDSVLKPREKVVLELRYGLKNGCFMAQREIAEILGISRSYVSRIEKKALQKLSDAVNNMT